jgi:uncharacterized protein (TIGR02284 family)
MASIGQVSVWGIVSGRRFAEIRLAGARGFRDFSRLPPAQENRGQPADPSQTEGEGNGFSKVATQQFPRELFMATDTARNYELEEALKSVINILEDGQKGMAEIGEHLKNETLKRYFLAESLKRANFRGELENELHRHGVADVHETGTVAGALHRTWADIKAKLGGGDKTLLETAEEGEDAAKNAYKDALDQDLPLPIRQLLTEQQSHILRSHDYIRGHRNALR